MKTKPGDVPAKAVIETLPTKAKQQDAQKLLLLFTKATGEEPVVWAGKYIGFGRYRYRYATGHQGEIYKTGFSVSKTKITLHVYLPPEKMEALLQTLGKAKAGKSCVYIHKLADVDETALLQLIKQGYELISNRYDEKPEQSK